MKLPSLPLRNFTRHPGRTTALSVLVALLALTLFAGSVIVSSLNNGLYSLENRLGADIIVVPERGTRGQLDVKNIWLQGTAGYYYMNASKLEEIRGIDGVEKASGQVYLASLRASCCSLPIQVIGFEPETDFTVQPWIAERLKSDLGKMELVVGSSVASGVGDSIRIYEQSCKVIARLDATGTGLDTAVYCTMDTMATLLDAARELNHELKISGDPAQVVSAVYVRVAPGADVQRVAVAIERTRNPGVQAVGTRSVTSDVENALSGISRTITVLIVCVWILALILLLAVFFLHGTSRKREFATLRVLGMSRRHLAAEVLKEALLVSLCGGLIGIGLALMILLPFSTLIESSLGLPYLAPSAAQTALYALGTLAAVCVAGPLTASLSAHRLSHTDTAVIMREVN